MISAPFYSLMILVSLVFIVQMAGSFILVVGTLLLCSRPWLFVYRLELFFSVSTEEKEKKFTLQDFLYRKGEGQFDMINFDDDEYLIVKLYMYIVKNLLPPKELGIEIQGCFFQRIASKKELNVSFFVI